MRNKNFNITEPFDGLYQVRLVRKKKEYSKTFSVDYWGGKKKAQQAARNWRDQQILVLAGKGGRRSDWIPARNASTGVLGVCRLYKFDKRRGTTSLYFSVNWKDFEGKFRIKCFWVGNVSNIDPSIEQSANDAAISFRKDWEEHKGANTLDEFDDERYINWRTLF